MDINIEKITEKLVLMAIEYGPKLAMAIVTLIIGLWVVGVATNAIKRIMEKKDVDPSLRGFLTSLCRMLFKAILFISVLGMVGVKTTSLIAILGAAGLAVGLALKDSLGNFAASVMILVFRPYKVGDLVELEGTIGTVQHIQIFCTILNTPGHKKVIIPNGKIVTNKIINISDDPIIRIDHTIGIGYGDDIKKAKKVLMDVLEKDKRILSDPAPYVGVSELADSSVNFVFRPWVKNEDYWDVYFDTLEAAKLALDENGISIPFPQRDVHIKKDL